MKVWKAQALPPDWFKRVKAADAKDSAALEKKVKTVIQRVREQGDVGLLNYARRFDGAKLNVQNLRVTLKEIQSAYEEVSEEQIAALKLMKGKLETIEKRILQQQLATTSCEGITVQTVLRPIESVGC